MIEVAPGNIPRFDVDLLVGNFSKARRILGWKLRITFCEIVAELVAAHLAAIQSEAEWGADV